MSAVFRPAFHVLKGFPRRSVWAVALLACSATAALAGESGAAEAPPADLAERLVVDGRAMPVRAVDSTPLPGIFEVRLESGQTFYSDREGEYLVVGDLYRNSDEGMVNLTEQRQQQARVERVSQVPDEQTVVFRPAGEVRAVLNVFTDVTCPYCRQFHEEVPALNERGIEVRYFAFPRSGVDSEGARILEKVWCSDNPSEAMTAAKQGDSLDEVARCDAPVAEQFDLGRELGVQGTPALILPDGRMIPGYVPLSRLMEMMALDE